MAKQKSQGKQQGQQAQAPANIDTVQKMLSSPAMKKQMERALPKHLNADRLLRISLSVIRTNPRLAECTQQSLAACIMGCAQLGLEPEPFLGQAYLVPFWNKHKNAYEAQLIPGYRGYISLARRSGEVQTVFAQVVHEGDYFHLRYGLDPNLEHEPADDEQRGEPTGAYVVFRYKDGSYSFDYMSYGEIERIRQRSKSPNEGPWKTDWAEMAKKSVIRRHVKLVPLSVEMNTAVAAEHRAIEGEAQGMLFGQEDPEADGAAAGQSAGKAEPEPDPQGTVNGFWEKMQRDFSPELLEQIEQFVSETAEYQNASNEDVMAYCDANWEQFKESFEQWRASKSDK